MHFIIIIALGMFGGLWLFTRSAEWHERRRQARPYPRGVEVLHSDPHRTKRQQQAAMEAQRAAQKARLRRWQRSIGVCLP